MRQIRHEAAVNRAVIGYQAYFLGVAFGAASAGTARKLNKNYAHHTLEQLNSSTWHGGFVPISPSLDHLKQHTHLERLSHLG